MKITTDAGDFVIETADDLYSARISQNGDGRWWIQAFRGDSEEDAFLLKLRGIPTLTDTADAGIEAGQKAIHYMIDSDISDLQRLMSSTEHIPAAWTAAKETEPVKAIFAYLEANPVEEPDDPGYLVTRVY